MVSAAALKYDVSMPAPFVVADGKGELAKKMLTLAKKYGIPVRSDTELAERLVFLRPGEMIPQELFGPIAAVFALIIDMEQRQARQNEKNSD